MSKIAIHLDHPLIDGEQVTFRSPCASADATGLTIYTPTSYEDDTEISAVYDLKDAGGTTIHGKTGLFASGAYVTVVLDTTNSIAYVHNARSVYIGEINDVNNPGLVPAPTSAKPYRFYSTGGGGNPGWNTGPAFTGASASENGITGLVPGPSSGNYSVRNFMYLRSSGAWAYLPLQNNAATTEEHYALDARMGKTLQDQITRLNRNDHYDITLGSGMSGLGSQTLWILGSVAVLHLCFRATSALAAYARIATLPTGNQYAFPGNYATNKWGSSEARTINISSAGVITLGPQAMAVNDHVEFLVIGRAVATS